MVLSGPTKSPDVPTIVHGVNRPDGGSQVISIVQLDLTRVVGGTLVKVMSWYDNEWGFTSQMIQVAVQQLELQTAARV